MMDNQMVYFSHCPTCNQRLRQQEAGWQTCEACGWQEEVVDALTRTDCGAAKDKRIAELEEQLAASGEALSRIIEMHKEIVLDNLTLKIELAQAGGVNARMREELLKYYRRHIRGWPTRPHHITYYKNRIAELEGE
jgi:hypothetical protein